MPKQVIFAGSSREDLKEFPDEVKLDIGYALYQAQMGEKPKNAKPLTGFGSAGVLEIIGGYDGSTYRAVYTVKFAEAVYVLHAFQKKAKQGIKTPCQDKELVKRRLKIAEADHKANYRRC
jgi:phage-related protein